jgi:prevent-host-death family protein
LGFVLFMAIIYGYNCDMKVSVADAKNQLPKLIRAAEQGQRVTICRHGKPVVDLIRSVAGKRKKPRLGTLRGRVIVHDPDWWKPMAHEEVDEMFGTGK